MKTISGVIAVCALAAIQGSVWAAQVPIPNDTVAERTRQELDPAGVRAGAFKLYPSLKLGLIGDDNIYADANDRVSDAIRVVTPRIDVRSDWSRHEFRLRLSARLGRYSSNPTENFDDLDANLTGRVSISRASDLALNARVESLHQDRDSPDDQDGLTPTEFDRSTLAAEFTRNSGRFAVKLDVTAGKLDYDDVASLDGHINHDDRDRSSGELGFSVGYFLSPSTTIHLDGSYKSIDYDSDVDDNGFKRDSSGGRIAIGAEFDLTSLTSLNAQIGLRRRGFDDPRLEDVRSLWFDGRLIHRLSGLTTLSASASREFRETTFASSPGYFATRYGAGVDHELLRNLVLKLHVLRQDEVYETISRHDDVVSTRFEANYMLNRNFDILLNYQVRDRDVDERFSDADHRTHTMSLSFVLKR